MIWNIAIKQYPYVTFDNIFQIVFCCFFNSRYLSYNAGQRFTKNGHSFSVDNAVTLESEKGSI